jgi:hypothetical protein
MESTLNASGKGSPPGPRQEETSEKDDGGELGSAGLPIYATSLAIDRHPRR